MHSSRDKSHAGNVANVDALLTLCQGFGSRYNPSQANLKLPYLRTRLEAVNSIMDDLINKLVADNIAINKRKDAFDKLAPLAARVVAVYSLCNVSKDSVKHVKSILKMIQGKRIRPVSEPADKTNAPKKVEFAKTSYMFKVIHLENLIAALRTAPDYAPNEPDLKLAALEAYLLRLQQANTNTSITGAELDTARTARDRALYRTSDGLAVLAQKAKSYLTVAFGHGSPESKAANSIRFSIYKFNDPVQLPPDPDTTP